MEISLVTASVKDIPVIRELAKITWNEHYPSIIGQAQVDYMLGKMYSESALTVQIQSGHVFQLIKQDGVAIGFISYSEQGAGQYFIHKFYILGNRQGRGLGQMSFEAWKKQVKPLEVKLTVNRQNYKSINFYFKIGFVINRVLDMDIGEGYVMNDFEMIWK